MLHPRDFYFKGRPARLSDLLEAGLLKPGDVLRYSQRVGRVHRAVINQDGLIELAAGKVYDSPSGAAAAAAGRAADGWKAWRRVEDFESFFQPPPSECSQCQKCPLLHDLREHLRHPETDTVLNMGRRGSRVTVTVEGWPHARIDVEADPFAGTIRLVLSEEDVRQCSEFLTGAATARLGDERAPLITFERRDGNVVVELPDSPSGGHGWPHLRFVIVGGRRTSSEPEVDAARQA